MGSKLQIIAAALPEQYYKEKERKVNFRTHYYYYYYKEKERKVNFRTRFFLMLANEFLAFEHSPLFFVDIIIHCSLLRTCRERVEEKEEFLVYTVLWTLTCHPYLESATALSDYSYTFEVQTKIVFHRN